jgi:hypothetical protein
VEGYAEEENAVFWDVTPCASYESEGSLRSAILLVFLAHNLSHLIFRFRMILLIHCCILRTNSVIRLSIKQKEIC